MPLEGKQRVVPHHAVAVVDDADQLSPAALNLNPNPRGSCIERVLQQLLHHGRRPLHHLAGSNLIGHLVGKYTDAPHGSIVGRNPLRKTRPYRALPPAIGLLVHESGCRYFFLPFTAGAGFFVAGTSFFAGFTSSARSPIMCRRMKFVAPDLVRVPATMPTIWLRWTYPFASRIRSAMSTSLSVSRKRAHRIGNVPHSSMARFTTFWYGESAKIGGSG